MRDDIEVWQALGELQAKARQVGTAQATAVVLASGEALQSVESLRTTPERPRGNVAIASWQSFVAMCEAMDPLGMCKTYYTREGTMRLVLNDNRDRECVAPDAIGWRDWTLTYAPVLSESWEAWMKVNGNFRPQLETGEFIQDRSLDFQRPTGAKMLEIATNFSATRSGKFVSAVSLENGSTAFTLDDVTVADARKQLTVPNDVDLGMRVFDDMDAYKFKALFQWRAREGALLFRFKIVELENIKRAAVSDLVERVQKARKKSLFVQVSHLPEPIPSYHLLSNNHG